MYECNWFDVLWNQANQGKKVVLSQGKGPVTCPMAINGDNSVQVNLPDGSILEVPREPGVFPDWDVLAFV